MMPENIEKIDCKIQFIKTHPDAQLPSKNHYEDNCFDVYAVEDTVIPASMSVKGVWCDNSSGQCASVRVGSAVVPVGLKVAYISPGYGFVVRGRSGLGFKHGIIPFAGELDNGYRGDCGIKLFNLLEKDYTIKKGDRVAQLKVERVWDTVVEFTEEATGSTRGEQGFGSSGK